MAYANGKPSSPVRETLNRLARNANSGLIGVKEASEALGLSRNATMSKLSRLTNQGWIKRVRPGLYLVLPLEARTDAPTMVEDPWVLARELFSPCYIGGWSAAEYWGLTEQIFRSTFVVSSSNVRKRKQELGGIQFHIVRVPLTRLAGTKSIWRGQERMNISDRERTIVDALCAPGWIGGIRHLAEIIENYASSTDCNPDALIRVLLDIGKGSSFKRVGYLAERVWPGAIELIEVALGNRSSGDIKLDPAVRSRGRLNRRWGLWINARVPRKTGEA